MVKKKTCMIAWRLIKNDYAYYDVSKAGNNLTRPKDVKKNSFIA